MPPRWPDDQAQIDQVALDALPDIARVRDLVRKQFGETPTTTLPDLNGGDVKGQLLPASRLVLSSPGSLAAHPNRSLRAHVPRSARFGGPPEAHVSAELLAPR